MSEIRTLTQNINGTETEIAPRTFASAVTDSNGKTLEEIVNREWVLIEDFTLTESVQSITRTQEPDSTPYNFKSLSSVITVPAQTTLPSNKNIASRVNNNATGYFGNAISSSQTVSSEQVDIVGGKLSMKYMHPIAGYDYGSEIGSRMPFVNYSAQAIISYKIETQVLQTLIPSGTNVKIYAIRN